MPKKLQAARFAGAQALTCRQGSDALHSGHLAYLAFWLANRQYAAAQSTVLLYLCRIMDKDCYQRS